jgi:hypothetical protein
MRQIVQVMLFVAVASTVTAQTFDAVSVKPSPPPPGNPFGFPVIGNIRMEVDKTGLAGTYAFELATARDTSVGRIPGAPPPADDGISLLTGVQDQLGLKLESAHGRRGAARLVWL